MQGKSNIYKSINIIQHINQGQKSYHHFNRCRESLWQNSTSLHDKSSEEIKNRRKIIKALYDKPIANITLKREKLKPFPLKSGTIVSTVPILIQYSFRNPSQSNPLCTGGETGIYFQSCTCGHPVFPAPIVEGTVFSPMYVLGSFVKNQTAVVAWICVLM
jgi:hypothetical protein